MTEHGILKRIKLINTVDFRLLSNSVKRNTLPSPLASTILTRDLFDVDRPDVGVDDEKVKEQM